MTAARQPITTAFDRGYSAGTTAGPMGAKPANPYKIMKQFNAWEYGFSHARRDSALRVSGHRCRNADYRPSAKACPACLRDARR